MPAILPTLASVSLLHALYSSYEVTHLRKTHATDFPFPVDIQLEVAFSVVLFLLHIFLFSGRPTQLSLVDNERLLVKQDKLNPVLMKDAVSWDELKGGNATFKGIETRLTFLDIHKKREEYAAWEKAEAEKEEKLVKEKEEKKEKVEETKD